MYEQTHVLVDKDMRVLVSAEDVGDHFGCVGVVRRARDRRVIHRTPPHPFRFLTSAQRAAIEWALAHGYAPVVEGGDGEA